MNEYQEMHPCNLHHPDFYNRQRNLKVSNNKLYINIFHDSENCFLHRNWKGNASRLYDEVVRSIANAVWPGNSLNISEDLIVNWHWVLPAKDNNYKVNEGAQRVLQDRGVVFQVAKDKSGAVDIAVDALMNAFRVTFDGFKPERQKQTVAVLLSGDSDFGLQVKQLRQAVVKWSESITAMLPQDSEEILTNVFFSIGFLFVGKPGRIPAKSRRNEGERSKEEEILNVLGAKAWE
eukprot:CAMPEP_0201518932 /NCGR_PEP_ID=MMETSP0161_2-20130828/9644_1 /ASSEMBLY_ACC=CAM_ASM_000251 /TAXON_ID=180227 /ORGANISM="Neoparamoeba aestuarina, Strain SoJaBio B1-5/56/2" /LENGTH=233 /DNA_ID=CAMNT_0047916847 /DNA_START=55 /DNA_END=757 /DNA_ORIENTATION=+